MSGNAERAGIQESIRATIELIRSQPFLHGNLSHRIGYSAEGKINRKDFGMTFSMMLDGKFIVSDEIQIMIEGEFVEQKPA